MASNEWTINFLPEGGGRITGAQLRQKGFMKQTVVTMNDDSVFVFDYGMLNPRNLIAQINA